MRYLTTLALLLFCTLAISAQEKDLVTNQGITSAFHQASIGKIAFSITNIPAAEFKEGNDLSAADLTNKSSLFITAFLGNSLTNYLHQLAPALSAEELYKNGNYQFSFYVDGKAVYLENLNYGAGVPKTKDTETVISKPLINFTDGGRWWSESMWNRFLANGGKKALAEGKHLLKIEIRPYLNKDAKLITGKLIAAGQIELTVKKTVVNVANAHLQEVKPYHDLQVSQEKFDVNKIRELKANIDEAVFKQITSIVVLKNNKILIEEYFNGDNRDSLHDVRSVGKSFASTITGIAIGEGYLKNEDQTLKEFYDLKKFDNYSAKKETVSLKDLLTMSSDFNGNDDDSDSPGNEENMYPTANWPKFTLDLPVNYAGAPHEWHYFTAGVLLLGDILNNTVPGGLDKYADAKLFKPLGITGYKWQYTPQNVPNTAGGIRMNTLDFAKYGQLYKNGGKWNGKQVVPAVWVDKTFSKQRNVTGRKGEFYGYLFWNKAYQVKGKAYGTYYCSGNGGNKIFVFKDEPLVIVVTATAYGTSYAHAQVDQIMEDYILPAVLGVH